MNWFEKLIIWLSENLESNIYETFEQEQAAVIYCRSQSQLQALTIVLNQQKILITIIWVCIVRDEFCESSLSDMTCKRRGGKKFVSGEVQKKAEQFPRKLSLSWDSLFRIQKDGFLITNREERFDG